MDNSYLGCRVVFPLEILVNIKRGCSIRLRDALELR